jgi:ATP-dependent DNA helicase DinG
MSDSIYLKYKPRPQQDELLEFLQKGVEKNKKFFLIQAPTGSGKSFLPVMFTKWYQKKFGKGIKVDIITHTKSLQTQYVKDFEFIQDLRGKNNYTCDTFNCTCDEGQIISKSTKTDCVNCPYKIASGNYIAGNISLTNYQMFNSYWMYVPFVFNNSPYQERILFVDEAHLYEENFCSFIETRISPRILSKLGINDHKLINELNKISVVSEVYSYLKEKILNLAIQNKSELMQEIKASKDTKESQNLIKRWQYIDEWICRVYRFCDDYEEGNNKNWILEQEKINDKKNPDQIVIIKPVWGKDYIKKYIWNKYKYVVLMSATILEPTVFSKMMNIKFDEAQYINLKHTFPEKKRPIVYMNTGKLSRKFLDQTLPKMAETINKILYIHRGHKGIIHTANYNIANEIVERINSSRLLIHETDTREDVYEYHLASKEPTVLVSPSMFTGVDLKDNLSRFQIIAKVPYPYLGSISVQKRKELIPFWYNWKTMNDLIQSYGRSIRHLDDWAVTYILDGTFEWFFRQNSKYFPDYFHSALKEGPSVIEKLKKRK